MQTNKVLFTNCSLSSKEIALLRKGNVEIIKGAEHLSEDELIEKLQGCQGYVIGGIGKATKRVIDSTNLKIINFYGTGYENYIDLAAAAAKNIVVANTPKANAYTVAEFTVALILNSVKQIARLHNLVRQGKWGLRQAFNLKDKTLGVIGMGTIGQHVAKIMSHGFGMKIIYVSRNSKPNLEKELQAHKVSLDELLSSADVVTIHTPCNDETKGMIGEAELSKMQTHAILVNTARADIVNGKALRQALDKSQLATAAFDTYYQEPAPSIEEDAWGLLSLPDDKFILTPHTAYNSKEAFQGMNDMVVENLTAFFKGEKPPYSVN